MKLFTARNFALVWAAGLLLLVPLTDVQADLTLSGHSSVTALGIPSISQETLWVKGPRLRRDVVERGRAYSYIYDPVAKQVDVVDHALQQVEIHSMHALASDTDGKMDSQNMQLTLTPTGRKQALQSWDCAENELAIVLPAQLGTEPVTLSLTGHVWLARKVKEQAEMAVLFRTSKTPDFFVGIPAFVKAAPALAGAFNAAITKIGPKDMLCAAEVETHYEGKGQLVELAKRMGTRMGVSFDQYKTDALPDSLFEAPANYRVIRR